jgi:hypothetical protein
MLKLEARTTSLYIYILSDNKSAVDICSTFKDTQYSIHILRCWYCMRADVEGTSLAYVDGQYFPSGWHDDKDPTKDVAISGGPAL